MKELQQVPGAGPKKLVQDLPARKNSRFHLVRQVEKYSYCEKLSVYVEAEELLATRWRAMAVSRNFCLLGGVPRRALFVKEVPRPEKL